MLSELHLLALDISPFCYNNAIILEIDSVRRSLNDKVDYLNKIFGYGD